jgi:hypothetical protein|tara:strand:- start:430 stop:660 length:231 start_codon:yes stop_codon:yes gene_type:complete
MNFPPFPPISLNISKLTIDEIDVTKVKFNSELLDLPLTPIYILFICIFVLVFIQTIILIVFFHKYRYGDSKRLLFG